MTHDDEPLPAETVEAVFAMLVLGASPAAACRRLEVDPLDFHLAVALDDELRERLERLRDDLTWNVAARLYQKAMEGNVPAMTNWLKLRPPTDWRDDEIDTQALVDGLTDELLVPLAASTRTPLPPDIARALSASGEPPVTGPLPPPAATDGR